MSFLWVVSVSHLSVYVTSGQHKTVLRRCAQYKVELPFFWQITQVNVVKLCSRLAARYWVFTGGLCWIKSKTVVLHLDGQPVGQFSDESWWRDRF